MTDFTAGPTIAELSAALASGRTTSRQLVDEALARIADPRGEGKRIYTKVYDASARQAAEAQDLLRKAGYALSPVAGLPISIKDLFDVAGEPTTAGSVVLKDAAPAAADAPIVARLKRAGAVITGKTNMTEFAYSGVGINPHYGTPGNPFDRERVPGGSSSGAAVSVADGTCVVAIGTDTGGSVRIPAALCGLYGFKPSQYRVPRDGAAPLSTTLDSIGPLARSVEDCAIVDAILADEAPVLPAPRPPASLRFAVPQNLFLDNLGPEVARDFAAALKALRDAGVALVEQKIPGLDRLMPINREGGFSAAEAYRWHAKLLETRGDGYDRRVGSRILRGKAITAAHYIEILEERRAAIAEVTAALDGFDGMLAPTIPIVAPKMAEFAEDSEYLRLNLLLLRNCTPINLLDGCAMTIPIEPKEGERKGEAPVGLMLAAPTGADRRVLAASRGIAPVLEAARRK